MIGFAAERLMELEVGAKTGADYGEKSSDRLVRRNGYRDRDWQTRAGSVERRIPRPGRLLFPFVPRTAPVRREGANRVRHCRSDHVWAAPAGQGVLIWF